MKEAITMLGYESYAAYLTDLYHLVSLYLKRSEAIFFTKTYSLVLVIHATNKNKINNLNLQIKKAESSISDKLKNSRINNPFKEFCKKHGFNYKEEMILALLVYSEATFSRLHSFQDLIKIISSDYEDFVINRKLFLPHSSLYRSGVICGAPTYSFDGYIGINKMIIDDLLGLRGNDFETDKKDDMSLKKGYSRYRRVERNILKVRLPQINLDEVVLPPLVFEDIHIFAEGIKRQANMFKEDRNKFRLFGIGLSLILDGPPGTGKTLTAEALAGFANGILLEVDCARIEGMYVGESEKNTRAIFEEYRNHLYLVEKERKFPILFFNEADQVLSKRIDIGHSVDAMYNHMQNILLDELDKFQGILIATTNMIGNIDPAFSRRFFMKTTLPLPGPEERGAIWRLCLKNIPHSEDIDYDKLAIEFEFSGGQINLAVKRAKHWNEIMFGYDYLIKMEELWREAVKEKKCSFQGDSKKTIGFSPCKDGGS